MNGDYGITQFAYAIVDKPENLQKIKNVFDSKDFRNLMKLSTFGQGHINYKVISILKKDFWKVFIDKNDETKTDAKEVVPIISPIKKKPRIKKELNQPKKDNKGTGAEEDKKSKGTEKEKNNSPVRKTTDFTPIFKRIKQKKVDKQSKGTEERPKESVTSVFNKINQTRKEFPPKSSMKRLTQTFKRGGKSKKRTRKNKGNKYR